MLLEPQLKGREGGHIVDLEHTMSEASFQPHGIIKSGNSCTGGEVGLQFRESQTSGLRQHPMLIPSKSFSQQLLAQY